MCIDFIYLNKAIPKKSYPLSRIDQLVDSLASNELLPFLDTFKGYYQIPKGEKDMQKSSFVTDIVIFCYTRMPFGLWNARADFKEGMNKTFKGLE